ncbi:MAG: hypothetical protein C0462_04255 [Alcanivorax sp.]|nr:hypothetical protein [Alcanivorax sp.]
MSLSAEDDITFFSGAGRGEALDVLCDAGLRGGLAAVHGPQGAGVSTLLGEAAMRLLDAAAVVRVDGSQTPSRNALLSALLLHFGVSKDEFAGALERALASEPLVLIIDEAEHLGDEALTTLAALRQRLGAGFAVLLGGSPALSARLAEAGLTLTDDLGLTPLDRDEAALFLDEVAAVELDEDELEALCADDGAWPGELMAAVPPPTLKPGPLSGFALPWRHVAAVGGLILVVVILWPRDRSAEQDVPLTLPARPVPETVTAAPDERPARPPAREQAPEPDRARPPQPEPEPEPAPRPQPEPEPEPQPEPQPEPAQPEAPQPEPSAPAVVRADTAPAMSGMDAELGYRREEWLLTAPRDQWMLQVTLATTEDAARSLSDRLGTERSAYYRARRNERNVFIVLAGPYASREAATAGRADLPSDLASAGPFPRQIGAIRDELGDRAD